MGTAQHDEGGSRRAAAFDQAFRPAVEAGHLTPAQAYARGNRAAYVDRLQKRYGLSVENATRVADNEIQLPSLVREEAIPEEPRNVRVPILGIVAMLALLTIAIVSYVPGRSSLIGPRADAAVVDGMTFDQSGRVVRVIGDSPEQVLEAYCTGGDRRRCRALGLMPTVGEQAAVRIGVYRAPDRADAAVRALAIRHDTTSGRWYAGDGVEPLVGAPPPPGAVTAAVGAP